MYYCYHYYYYITIIIIINMQSYSDSVNVWFVSCKRLFTHAVTYVPHLQRTVNTHDINTVYKVYVCNFFTALHPMQTQSSDEKAVRPSVRPFVCLSVRLSNAWIVTKRADDWYRPRWPLMTLNAVIALILRFHRIRQIFRPNISQWLKTDL